VYVSSVLEQKSCKCNYTRRKLSDTLRTLAVLFPALALVLETTISDIETASFG